MPRDGALTLSDVRDPALSIVCELCGRRETYDVARLMGDSAAPHVEAAPTSETPRDRPERAVSQRSRRAA